MKKIKIKKITSPIKKIKIKKNIQLLNLKKYRNKKILNTKDEHINNNVDIKSDTNSTNDLNYLNVENDIKPSAETLDKKFFSWRHRKMFGILTLWAAIFFVGMTVVFGVNYSTNYRLINFGYDYASVDEIAIPNWTGNTSLTDYDVFGTKDGTTPNGDHMIESSADFLKDMNQMHKNLDNFFAENKILYYDNISDLANTKFNPHSFLLNPSSDDLSQYNLNMYIISFNVGVSANKSTIEDTFKSTEVKLVINEIMNQYRNILTPALKNNGPGKYNNLSDVKSNSDWISNWGKYNRDNNLFFYTTSGSSAQLTNLVLSVFVTFLVLTIILVLYSLIRYGSGNVLAIIFSFISYGVLATAVLLPTTLFISSSTIIMIFVGYILMILNIAILLPAFVKFRKQHLLKDKEFNKTKPETLYSIMRALISKNKKIFILELVVILVPIIIYMIGNAATDIHNKVPVWIIFQYHLANEFYLLICLFIAFISLFIVYLPLWALFQSRSINFWRHYEYKAIHLDKKHDEASFDGINEIDASKDLKDPYDTDNKI